MRKLLFILIALVAPLTALAQQGLHIDELFQGRIIPQERMVETRVRGRSIEKYQLSYYRSLRLNATDKDKAAQYLNDYTADALGAAAYRWQQMARDFWLQSWKGF